LKSKRTKYDINIVFMVIMELRTITQGVDESLWGSSKGGKSRWIVVVGGRLGRCSLERLHNS